MQKLLRIFTLGFIYGWFCIFCLPASALELEDQTLLYSVDYRGTNAGEIEIVIAKTESGYLVKSISHLSMLAKMFLQSYTIESSFELIGEQPRLTKGREILNKTGEENRSFSVDYVKRNIQFSDKEQHQFPETAWLDAEAFPLALIFSNPATLDGKSVLSVNSKRARELVFQQPVQETISVPAGNFDSYRITSLRQDDPSRFVSVWLRRSDNPIPLKIVTGKSGKETTMVLTQ